MRVRKQVKTVLGPVVRSAWPVVETIGALEARARRGRLDVRWSEVWTAEFDRALDSLRPLPDCPHDLYRELLKPTNAHKRHALVLEDGEPSALISLRRCARHWEPVAYQCLPNAIAPAVSEASLTRALHSLGLEVRVPAGLRDDVLELDPSVSWSYDCHAVDLNSDYEAFWNRNKRHRRIVNRARRLQQTLEARIDGAGDLEWIVEQWCEQWKDDPGGEVVAADDRRNFWRALARRSSNGVQLHTLALIGSGKRVAGWVITRRDGVAGLQCVGRDLTVSDSGNAITIFAVEWAKARGLRLLDLGSGIYKRDWGPVGDQRYAAVFRPHVMSALSWACEY